MTNSYVYGSGNELLMEMKASGAWHHSNVYANGRLIATYHDTNTYFFVRRLARPGNNVPWLRPSPWI
jgi:hypothetical protein